MEEIAVHGFTISKLTNHQKYMETKIYIEKMCEHVLKTYKQRNNDQQIFVHYVNLDTKERDRLTIYIKDDTLSLGIYNPSQKIVTDITHGNPPITKDDCTELIKRMDNTITRPLLPKDVSIPLQNAWEEKLHELEQKKAEQKELKKNNLKDCNPLAFAPWDERMTLVKEATAEKNAEIKERHISYDDYER